MSNIAEYVGRTVDVLAYTGASPDGERLLTQSLASNGGGGQVCTGLQKLSQRFAIMLLTEKGTVPYLPDRGSDFMTQARLGRLRTQVDVMSSFSAAMIDVLANMKAEETTNDPDDERIDTADLLSVAVSPGFASITVQVSSRAGGTTSFIMPLDFTP